MTLWRMGFGGHFKSKPYQALSLRFRYWCPDLLLSWLPQPPKHHILWIYQVHFFYPNHTFGCWYSCFPLCWTLPFLSHLYSWPACTHSPYADISQESHIHKQQFVNAAEKSPWPRPAIELLTFIALYNSWVCGDAGVHKSAILVVSRYSAYHRVMLDNKQLFLVCALYCAHAHTHTSYNLAYEWYITYICVSVVHGVYTTAESPFANC